MIKFISLFSGSSGNSYFLQIDENKYLVDVGVAHSKIVQELKKIGEKISNIDAIFITHEHIDHVRALSLINKKYNIPIYINKKTFNQISSKIEIFQENNIKLFTNEEFKHNNIKIKPFSVLHDAIDPVGFSFFDKNDNKATVVTDLGKITDEVYDNVVGSDLLVLEANYDEELIRYSEYPLELINRIVSSEGHLPNSESLNLVADLVDKGLKHIALAHISRSNNNFEIVSQMFEDRINLNKDIKEKANIKVLRHDGHSEALVIKDK